MFHKEGSKIILIASLLLVTVVILAGEFIDIAWLRMGLQIITLFFYLMILQFFRNPNRSIAENNNHIVAPVDGKVVVIEEVFEPEYFKDKRLQVSIFMSPINVHVTRYGISGLVKFSKYHPGKFLVAWHPKASTDNERTTVVIENPVFGEIMYRQIAGALAKRIVNYAEEGTQVVQGDDAGFIKFGSRVDLYLPLGTKNKRKTKRKSNRESYYHSNKLMVEKDLDTLFQKAIDLANTIPQASLPQDVQLRCYAYYKQATFGSLGSVNYSNLDVRDAFKNNAWMQISDISEDEAKRLYIDLINEILKY